MVIDLGGKIHAPKTVTFFEKFQTKTKINERKKKRIQLNNVQHVSQGNCLLHSSTVNNHV